MTKPRHLKKPCAQCPFRGNWLTKGSAIEIVTALRNDKPFSCHKTVNYDRERDGMTEAFCAGALASMRKSGELFNNFAVRVHAMTMRVDGWPANVDGEGIPSLDEWIDLHDDNGRSRFPSGEGVEFDEECDDE